MRVVVSAFKDFDDQRIAQRALLQLRKQDEHAVLICGANNADRMVGNVWHAFGGRVHYIEAEFGRGESRKQAMQDRNIRALNQPTDLCLSFEVYGQQGWMARLCKQRKIITISYDVKNQVVEAQ